MDNQRSSPALSWTYFYQGKNMEEMRQSLLYTTLELETTRITAQEEIQRREDQVNQLKDLLNKAIKEKDEAEENFQRLLMNKLINMQQPPQQNTPLSGVSSIEDEPRRGGGDSNNTITSSDCEDSIVSSPAVDPILPSMLTKKPLPEKGQLLQAVMKAGPLLQTLLLAGPLPQWQHPPPPLNSFEIPPVVIPSPPPFSPLSPHFLHHDKLYARRSYICGEAFPDTVTELGSYHMHRNFIYPFLLGGGLKTRVTLSDFPLRRKRICFSESVSKARYYQPVRSTPT